ncbi:MAG: LysR family transcriptional regulator [Desulfovibrionaceae bacterium]|nr:LysR family transcriptional regulator [Desulfovibrionaceae bacterium]
MEIRVLRYFLAVVREQNISRASESLHLTQPTLSRQLAELEAESGLPLFKRGRQLVLTEAGEMLRHRAEEAVTLMERIEADFRQRGDVGGTLAIGSGVYAAGAELVRSLEEFSLRYPKVKYEIYTNSADTLRERLDAGLLDFALLQEPIDVAHYEYFRLPTKDVWGLFMRADSPLAEKEKIRREDLAGRRLVCTGRLAIRREVEHWLGDADDLLIFMRHNLVDNTVPLVVDGFADAITIESAVRNYDPAKAVFRPFSPSLKTTVVLAWKRFQPSFSAAGKFLEFIKEKYAFKA